MSDWDNMIAPVAIQCMTKAEEANLIQKHEKLIRHMVRSFRRATISSDDLLQEARMALVLSARTWRGESSFWTHARRRVLGALIDAVTVEVERQLPEDFADGSEDVAECPEASAYVVELLDSLSDVDKQIAKLRLVRGLTVRQTGDAVGLSKSEVGRRWQSIVATLAGNEAA